MQLSYNKYTIQYTYIQSHMFNDLDFDPGIGEEGRSSVVEGANLERVTGLREREGV